MKGFNIAPTAGSGAPLAPVAEFIASLQAEPEMPHHHDLFGSTISGILGGSHTFPKKSNHLHMSLHGMPHPSSAPPFTQSSSLETPTSSHKSFSKLAPKFHASKRNSGHKRRWGTLIEAAKSGKVSKLINRSRSEDSVCNSNTQHSNSPGSDDNITESQSDSNPSLAETFGSGLSSIQSGLTSFGLGSGALAALRRKRKKFSASRSKNNSNDSKNVSLTTISGGCSSSELKNKKMLKRASSVPTKHSEISHAVRFHDDPPKENVTPSTTEESVETYAGNADSGISSKTQSDKSEILRTANSQEQPAASSSSAAVSVPPPPTIQIQSPSAHSPQQPVLLTTSTINQPSLSTAQPFKSRNGSAVLPNLPGIQPVSGHNMSHGWL